MDHILFPCKGVSAERESSSAPQSRCNSWKSRHRSSVRREKRLSQMVSANSVSMPDCSGSDSENHRKLLLSIDSKGCPLCTVRSFKTTSKGIIDSGSFSKSLSSNSLLSSGSLNTNHGSIGSGNGRRSISVDRTRTGSLNSSDSADETPSRPICVTPSYFRTLVLGSSGVGKSSLVKQFARSDSQNDDDEGKSSDRGTIVSVQLDAQESTMEFIDGADFSDLECYRADAFVLMYAVSEPKSFKVAASLLNHLRQDLGTDRTIFLVANKTDLVRQRLVPSIEARQFAYNNDCHYIETSTALNMNLDELLVGILCTIKNQLTPMKDDDAIENKCKLKLSNLGRPARSPNPVLSAISNFLKHTCRRDSRCRDVTPLLQLV